MKDLDSYIAESEAVLVKLCKEWRPKLMENMGKISFDLKADKSVVTKLDKEFELAIKDVLRPLSNEVGFLGEEHGQEGNENTYWTVDPIDGTEPFIRNIPTACNQLALVINGQPEYAFCYQFPLDNLYIARRGRGTTKNGKKITVGYKPLNRCWIDISIDLLDTAKYEAFKRLRPKIADTVTQHNYLPCVEGLIDGCVTGFNGGPWDYIPRALLMQEAGMKVGNFGSLTFDPKISNLVSAHPDNFEAIQKLLSPEA